MQPGRMYATTASSCHHNLPRLLSNLRNPQLAQIEGWLSPPTAGPLHQKHLRASPLA